jgi:NAD(P)H-hydrate epimerase
MGIGNSPETVKAVRYLLKQFHGVLILDADGLNALSVILSGEGTEILRNAACRVILTPHLKEFSRLNGKTVAEVRENMIPLAEEFAAAAEVIVLLKGPGTVITDGRETIITTRGCPGMASGGSGDVLSGILAAVCASNADELLKAAAAGAFINGYAGELAQKQSNDVVMSAADTAAHVRDALTEMLRGRPGCL